MTEALIPEHLYLGIKHKKGSCLLLLTRPPNRRTQQEQSYAVINYALQGGGRQSQLGAESAKPNEKAKLRQHEQRTSNAVRA